MKTRKNNFIIYLAALSYALIAGLSFVFTKIALEYDNPINILGHRFLFAFIALVIALIISGNLSYFNVEAFKKVLPLALVYPLLFFGFQTFGLQHVDSSIGGILLATAPIFTLILSRIFLKEKASLPQVLFVLLAVSGVAFIFYNTAKSETTESTNMLGIGLLLVTTICFSVYNIAAKEYTSHYKNLELLTVMITVGAIGFNILAFVMNARNGEVASYFTALVKPRYIGAIFYLGVLSTLVTSLLTNYVLSYLQPAKMSVFANLSTLISIVGGAVILNEDIFYYHIIGSLLIIAGVLGTNFIKPKEE